MLSYLGGQLRHANTCDRLLMTSKGPTHDEACFLFIYLFFFDLSSWPAPRTHQRLNLGDGSRAQSGEKSVPDDFLLLYSLSSPLTPSPPQRAS